SPSKQKLPKRRSVPQNRCYPVMHRKGGSVTEPARREYAAAMRPRYQRATKQERGRILDEYCRITGCHRKAAIRRLRAAARPAGGRPARPPACGRDLWRVLEQPWPASDQLPGKLLPPFLPPLLTALQGHHGAPLARAAQAALPAASPATLDRL